MAGQLPPPGPSFSTLLCCILSDCEEHAEEIRIAQYPNPDTADKSKVAINCYTPTASESTCEVMVYAWVTLVSGNVSDPSKARTDCECCQLMSLGHICRTQDTPKHPLQYFGHGAYRGVWYQRLASAHI